MSLRLLIILIISYVPSLGNTLEVCDKCNLKTIPEAVSNAESGDTIIVKEGLYKLSDLAIEKPLVLIGSPGTIIDGLGKSYVFRLLSDSIVIRGFTIVNSGRSYTKDYAAIYVFRSENFEIANNTIEDPFFGILIEKSKKGLVRNNKVSGNAVKEDDSGNGIHLWHCSKIQIIDNEVYGLRDGIYLEFVDESTIQKNHSHHNIRYGLHFMFSNNDKYLNNTFENNGAGVAVMFSKFIVMSQNDFRHNWGSASYGLLLKEIYDAEVTDNRFVENTIAIFIDGTTRVGYKGNLFLQNGWAMKVSGGCYSNHVSGNNFLGNTFDVSYNSKMNDNTFDGNYWGEYSGYDLNRDGIGDIPYRPVKLFSYIVNKYPESIVLMRSTFVDLINFSEKVSPVFTPDNLLDNKPAMRSF